MQQNEYLADAKYDPRTAYYYGFDYGQVYDFDDGQFEDWNTHLLIEEWVSYADMKPVLDQNKVDKDTIEEAVKAEDAAKLIEDQLMRDEEAA